jgi:capsular exopolysaccharide synthesis family protein
MKVSTDVANYEARLADVIRTAREVVRRRFLVLLVVAGLITVIGVTLSFLITPVYTGVTRIQIDPTRNPMNRNANDAQNQLASEAIETEVSVINSDAVARSVVERLSLDRDAEFTKGLDEAIQKGQLTKAGRMDAVVTRVHSHLAVSREKLTYIIGINFTSTDPVKAARIANAFATAYLDAKVGGNIGTAERQFAFYQKRLDELADEARAADAKVAQYKSEFGILSGNQDQRQTTIVDQQIAPLATQLAVADAASAEAKAKLAMAQSQVRSGRLDSVSEVLTSSTIVDLRAQRAQVLRALGEIEDRYGPRHPETSRVRDQLTHIDQQLREESTRVVRALQSNAASANAQAASLRSDMGKLENKQVASVRASVVADSLQREADSAHTAYDRMAQLAFETRQQSQNSIAQAKIIDAAEPPQAPSWPNRPLLMLLSLIVGVGAGIATITVQELMVSGMRSVEDVEGELGVPLLGAIPAMRKVARPADLLIEKPTSQFAEALRNARASIMGVKTDTRPKVIALTSALPSEGKTTTALSLARTMAINGQRTVIVDVDVRRAQLRQILGVASNGPGTIELLKNEVTLDEAIEPSGLENLDQIIVNKPYFSSENLFGNDQMPNILEALAARYDVIVLDLPPLLGLADGRFLAALADAVVMVIKWDATPQHAVGSALNSLRQDGSNVIGAIYTMVDSSSESVGAYYYYSKKYSAYYNQPTT